MRILFLSNPWAASREPARLVGTHPALSRGRHQWIRAVSGPALAPGDIPYEVHEHTVSELVERCPGGCPDVIVVWAPGYLALPAGIENAPCPVVACFSDWPLVMPGQAQTLDRYDYLFTDRAGVRVFQQMGYRNVEFWPMYAHDPVLLRVIPDVPKLWDIGMVGNLSPIVQRARAPWLARVARLADRYCVRIAGGVFNEAYTRMLNATKITFNFTFKVPMNETLRGAMNMRCYEAAACGSLLFCDEENEEIREFFEDRVHCVLYNEQNLEELLDYYLTHDEERGQIAAAAVERVEKFSFPNSLNRLADRLEELQLGERRRTRAARVFPLPELHKHRARHLTGSYSQGAPQAAAAGLREALAAAPDDPALCNDLAVVNCWSMGKDREANAALLNESLRQMRRAVELCPESAFFKLNLAHMLSAAGLPEAALELAQQAMSLLDRLQGDPSDPFCLPFPFAWDEFRVQYSALYVGTRSQPESFEPLRRCLLFHRGGMLLGKLAEAQGLLPMAVVGYRVAVAARPDLGSGHMALARALSKVATGPKGPEVSEAAAHLEAGLRTDPFFTGAWTLYADLLTRQGQAAEARQFLMERLTMLEALCPSRDPPTIPDSMNEMEAVREALLRQLASLPIAA